MAIPIPFHVLVFGSISIFISNYLKNYEELDKAEFFSNPANFEAQQFDFIVVGGGSPGSIVANRLSKEFSVLLLEAGGDPIPQTSIPANTGHIISDANPSAMHAWKSITQKHSNLGSHGKVKIQQGKFLGGSSVLNNLVYNRGHPRDFDNWAKITGDNSWSYASVAKYFRRTEDFHKEEEGNNAHLGIGGPLHIENGEGSNIDPVYGAFTSAGKELGYNLFNNSNNPQREGFGPISKTFCFGRRVSAFDAFIIPVMNRTTLTISRYSYVSHVNINKNGRAVGVFYTRHGIEQYAEVKKEIILSAGALNSPMILLRSGIGPEDQLKSAGIPLRINIPVGQNMQDHPWSGVGVKLTHPRKAGAVLRHALNDLTQSSVETFLKEGKGPLAIAWGNVGQAFIVSSISKSEGIFDWPDILLMISVKSPIYTQWAKGDEPEVQLMSILGRIRSRGSISLNLENITKPGLLNPNYLANDRDWKVLAKICAKVLETSAFQKLGFMVNRTVTTGCEDQIYDTDEYWQCHVKEWTKSVFHPVGTCRMGKANDPNTVMDPKLRVKGIKGLRVVDNSIQPEIKNANVNALVMMIGQKELT